MNQEAKIKVLFILPSLVAGGAERVISFVAQNIDKQEFEPILLVAGFEKDTVYDVSDVKVVYLNKPRILTSMPSIIQNIRRHKPHIVVSSISHVNMAMSLISPYFKRTKFLGREATVLSKRKNEKKARKWSLAHIIPNGFKNLDMIICQSRDMADDMLINFDIPKNRICVINNPISKVPKVKEVNRDSKIRRFITVGRLAEVKGHNRILRILAKLKFPFEYTIIGSGPLKSSILENAKKLGISDYIKHIPYTNKVSDFIRKNDLYLQGSYVEGFPNALLESCVVGTPVLAFNAPGGTKEIVEQEINGFLVNTEEEYFEKLNDNRNWNPEMIRDSVYRKFNKEKIIKEYEQLFIDVLK